MGAGAPRSHPGPPFCSSCTPQLLAALTDSQSVGAARRLCSPQRPSEHQRYATEAPLRTPDVGAEQATWQRSAHGDCHRLLRHKWLPKKAVRRQGWGQRGVRDQSGRRAAGSRAVSASCNAARPDAGHCLLRLPAGDRAGAEAERCDHSAAGTGASVRPLRGASLQLYLSRPFGSGTGPQVKSISGRLAAQHRARERAHDSAHSRM